MESTERTLNLSQPRAWPELYKATSSGALQYWQIRVEPLTTPSVEYVGEYEVKAAKLITTFGQIGTPNPQTTEDLISVGKNVGKKNETSAVAQAHAEAQSKWEKMQKKGYVADRERAAKEENDLQGVDCMLAHKYSEHAEKIDFPAAYQPKLDGIRCLTKADGTLWSRSQKPITSVPHIQALLKAIFPGEVPNLDGELYNHEFKSNFEKIVSIVRQTKKVDPEHELVQYHVYDVALPGVPFRDRMEFLAAAIGNLGPNSPIRLVYTANVESHDDLMKAFRTCRDLGYEGAMVRNLDSPYEGKRSYHLQKVKEFDEAEFRIVAALEGRGKLQGHVGSFQCVTESGALFEVKMEGELARLKEFFENPALWTDRLLTVQYQGLTGKNKVPRFPVGLRLREEGL